MFLLVIFINYIYIYIYFNIIGVLLGVYTRGERSLIDRGHNNMC